MLHCDYFLMWTILIRKFKLSIPAICCYFVGRDLNRGENCFESTVWRDFAVHFQMSRTTTKLLTREVLRTGKIPTDVYRQEKTILKPQSLRTVALVILNSKMSGKFLKKKDKMFPVCVQQKWKCKITLKRRKP